MKKVLLSLLIVLFGGYSAMSQLITFDDQGHTDGTGYGNPYTIVNGTETFVFTVSGVTGGPTTHRYRTTDPFCANTGFNHLNAGNFSATTWTIETQSGNEVDFGTIRFDNFFTCFAFTYNLSIQGFKNGVPTGTQAFAVPGGMNNIFTSNASFNDVDRIVITSADLANLGIDNINWAPAACVNPTVPTVTSAPTTICAGNSATLNISGTLNGATQWSVYTGSCGGTLVGTTATSSFVVSPGTTTTYFVRGTGGCSTPGACGSVTVNVSNVSVTASSQTNVSCFGGSNGAASVNVPTGGTAPYSFNWTPGNPTGDGTASVTGLTAGSWTCTVTDANSCTANRVFTITQPSALVLNAASQTNVSCFGGSNGAAAVAAATGGAGGYTYNWTPGNPTGDGTTSVTGLSAGSWTCTVTDANSCTANRVFTVTQPSALVLNAASQTNVSCFGGSNGAAAVAAASGGAGGYSYNWTPGNPTGDGTISVTGLTAGSWTCTVTDANSCTAAQVFAVTQPSALVLNAASQTNVSCFGGSNGAAAVAAASGGAGGYSYNWTPGNPAGDGTISVSGLTAGSWTCTVTDANSCTAAQVFTVTQPSALVLNAASQTNVSCFGGSNGAAAVAAASGGAGGYSYNWTPGNPTGDGTISVSGLTAGSWTCTVTDANSCTANRVFTITQPSALVVTASSQTNIACFGGATGAAAINAPTGGAGGYSFNWTPGNPTGDGTTSVSGLTAGSWTCTVTDANSCTAAQIFNITQPTLLAVTNASQNNPTCGGSNGTATVNTPTGGAGGYTFNWTPGNPTGDGTASVSGLTAGTWTCTVTDANGCTASTVFTLTPASGIVVSAASQSNVSCNAGSNGAAAVTAPTGGTAPYSFNWTPGNPVGDGTASVTGLTAGSWTCTVTDAGGCTASQVFTITQPSVVNANAVGQSNVSCNGGANGTATVSGSGGVAPYTFLWAPGGATTAAVTGLTAGSYTCTVTDANGCSTPRTFTITEPTSIVTNVAVTSNYNGQDISCNGASDGVLTASPSGGTAPYTFSWSPTGQTTASAINLAAGTYTCTVTDNNGCAASQSATLTQPSAIVANVAVISNYNGQNISCNGAGDGQLAAGPTGGTGPYTYLWSTGQTTATISGLFAGNYTSWVTDANGCQVTTNLTVTQPSPIGLMSASQNNATCGNSNGTATVNTATGGTGAYIYDWAPGTPTGDGTTSVSGLSAGTWTCTATDANGCTGSQVFTITNVGTPDNATFNYGAAAYCANSTDPTPTISGLAGGSFTSAPAGLSLNATTGAIDVSASTPGSYTITYTTNGPCPNSSGVSVLINAIDNAGFSYSAAVYCESGVDPTPTITGLAGGTFTSTPAGLSINASTGAVDLSASTPGVYSVSYTTSGACPNVSSASLTVNASSAGTDVQTACGSYTWIDGITYTSSNNTAQFILPNAVGCDSLVTLDLTILTQVFGSVTDVACDSYTWAQNGTTYTASGMYNDTLFGGSANGCDSIVTLNLTVNASTSSVDVVNACDSYTWLNGVTYTASNNSATMVYPNAAGCDSVVTLNLTLGLSTTTSQVVTVCDPSYTWTANGTTYTESGIYTAVLPSSNGCDSTVVLDLSLGGGIDLTVTQAGEMLIATQFIAIYQWIDCATNDPIVGATGQTFSPTVSGSYAVIITDNNCSDTSDCVNITVTGMDELSNEKLTIYPNPSAGNDVTFVYDGIISSVQVFDLVGRPVVGATKLVNNKLDVSALSYGKYIVKITTESSLITKELIIAR